MLRDNNKGLANQGDSAFAVQSRRPGEHHLADDNGFGDDGQQFGQVLEVAALSPLAVGDSAALMGVLQVSVTGCTAPEATNTVPRSCNGQGFINPGGDALAVAPNALLRVGDGGTCSGIAVANSGSPPPPVPVTCNISIRRSLQRAPATDRAGVAVGTAGEASPHGASELRQYRIRLQWDDGSPVAGAAYVAEADECPPVTGHLDREGRAQFALAAERCVVRYPDYQQVQSVAANGCKHE